ncbi:MAG TPA: AAA family ATPase [Bryobacteraceae bacterium]|jgi:predicted ATPase|nr:AAA family ATPase [Bryobacteraceae bacterium]
MGVTGPRFETLTIKGFRRLLDVKLELRPVSVMIGANGTGKTSVLDVLALLARSAKGELKQAISDLGGLAQVATLDRANSLDLYVEASGPTPLPIHYAIRLAPLAVGYAIEKEYLSSNRVSLDRKLRPLFNSEGPSIDGHRYRDDRSGKLVEYDGSIDSSETTLGQVGGLDESTREFRRRLASVSHYHVLNVEQRSAVRLPQQLRPAELPGTDGEDLVSSLFSLRESARKRFEAIEDSLRAAFPRFERLEFPPVAAGTISLGWREHGVSRPFYMNQLSEGTLRYLWLTTLLQSPGLTALTLIDEPEVSLHPELLSLLAEQFREASERTQLVVATHSDTLIRFLKPEEVVVLDSDEEGMTTLTRASELDLDEWLKDYSLDELWRNGRMGARA